MCWPQKGVNTFLATPLGKRKNQSAAIASKIPKPSEVDVDNIWRPTFEQLSAEDQKSLDDFKKKIREETEWEIQRKEEEAMKHYISHFSIDWQGKITKINDVTFDFSQTEVQTDVSKKSAIDTEIANMVDAAAIAHLNKNNKLKFVVKICIVCLMLALVK